MYILKPLKGNKNQIKQEKKEKEGIKKNNVLNSMVNSFEPWKAQNTM